VCAKYSLCSVDSPLPTRCFAFDDKEIHCQTEKPAPAAAIFVKQATTFYCPQYLPGYMVMNNRGGAAIGSFWTEQSPKTRSSEPFSYFLSSGANPKVVQRMLGHASAAMTLDRYADLFESDLAAVADNVSKMWPQSAQKGSIAP
jgi:hypothetical protein